MFSPLAFEVFKSVRKIAALTPAALRLNLRHFAAIFIVLRA